MGLVVAALAAGCQTAPMGTGLMDANPSPQSTAPAPSPTPTTAPAPATPGNAAGRWTSAPSLTAAPPGPPSSPASGPAGLLDVLDRPAERALLAGLRAYDDAQYAEAETQLKRALQAKLASPRDRAAAHKQLAFIFCTTARAPLCEAEFRAALKDDPNFTLTRGEAGHPMWGPVYKRVKTP